MFLDATRTRDVPSADNRGTRNWSPWEIVIPTYDKRLWLGTCSNLKGDEWSVQALTYPALVGKGKSAAFADINGDGVRDLVLSTENYEGTSGLVWLAPDVREISGAAGPRGLKFDRLELIDLDGDGDLDVLTTEERSGWDVVWFENPTR